MKVLAFAASNHSASINRGLLDYAVARLQSQSDEVEVDTLDINDFEMPIYSIDREKVDGIHPLAQRFFDSIGAADALLIAFPEYNGSVPSAWKNIFDWMSRIDSKVWQNKPMVLLSATPGPRAGAGVLGYNETIAPFFGGEIRAMHGVGTWGKAWDGEKAALVRQADVDAVDAAVRLLIGD